MQIWFVKSQIERTASKFPEQEIKFGHKISAIFLVPSYNSRDNSWRVKKVRQMVPATFHRCQKSEEIRRAKVEGHISCLLENRNDSLILTYGNSKVRLLLVCLFVL